MHRAILAGVIVVSPISTAVADTLNVPAEFTTIQAAINAASDGDVVLVDPGCYEENLDFLGKAIAVQSSSGPDETVIDGGQAGSVVTFSNGEDQSSLLSGFTIRNGSGTIVSGVAARGGGVYCVNGSSPTITNNYITSNSVTQWGGWSLLLSRCCAGSCRKSTSAESCWIRGSHLLHARRLTSCRRERVLDEHCGGGLGAPM